MHSHREKSLFLYNILSTQKASLEHKIYTAYIFYTHKVRENPTLPWGNAYKISAKTFSIKIESQFKRGVNMNMM